MSTATSSLCLTSGLLRPVSSTTSDLHALCQNPRADFSHRSSSRCAREVFDGMPWLLPSSNRSLDHRLRAQNGATTIEHGAIPRANTMPNKLPLSPPLLIQLLRWLLSRLQTTSTDTGLPATSYVTRSCILINSWILDSGAIHHLTSSTTHLTNTIPLSPTTIIHTANGTPLPMTCVGHLRKLSLLRLLCPSGPKRTMNIFSVTAHRAKLYRNLYLLFLRRSRSTNRGNYRDWL